MMSSVHCISFSLICLIINLGDLYIIILLINFSIIKQPLYYAISFVCFLAVKIAKINKRLFLFVLFVLKSINVLRIRGLERLFS